MVHIKKMFIEITTLEPVNDELVYNVLHKNIKDCYIKIYKIDTITYKDV